jgi:hypothetical protein
MKTARLASVVFSTTVTVVGCALAAGCASPADESSAASQSIENNDPSDQPGLQQGLTLPQTTDYTIEVPGATNTYRVVAYGDSIFAGYNRSIFSVARRAGPLVAGEYAALAWNANVEVIRRTESGAVASQVYTRIQNEKSYMQDAATRAVYFEMCGNDYLQARTAFKGQSGTCDFSGLDAALAACGTNTTAAMVTIAASAPNASHAVMNLYYPGFNADNANAGCTVNGAPANVQNVLLPYMAHSNWRTCTTAAAHGFGCADAFAEMMGADFDANGDGVVDSEALRFDPNESEDAYVTRITTTLRGTLRDSNFHELGSASAQADYLQGDDTHPTYFGNTMGSGGGKGAPDFTAAQVVDGKNPQWNLFGHERIGYALSKFLPAAP